MGPNFDPRGTPYFSCTWLLCFSQWLFLHQMNTAFKSAYNCWQTLRLDIERKIFRSSAKRRQTECFTTSAKSLMKSRKITGQSWLPWATAELTLNLLENNEPILTILNVFIKYKDIHERICELNPNLLSFWISIAWLT